MEWNQFVWYALAAIGGTLLGYLFGMRRARRVTRRVVQQMNTQSLELLDAKASNSKLQGTAVKYRRNQKILKQALLKLQVANKDIRLLRDQQETLKKLHFVEMARLRLRTVQSAQTAKRAASIARKATLHLRRLEKASPVTQTIEAHEPKSYGTGEPVTVSVVDHSHLDGSSEAVAKVSNRDSDRLIKLHSSNEATAKAN